MLNNVEELLFSRGENICWWSSNLCPELQPSLSSQKQTKPLQPCCFGDWVFLGDIFNLVVPVLLKMRIPGRCLPLERKKSKGTRIFQISLNIRSLKFESYHPQEHYLKAHNPAWWHHHWHQNKCDTLNCESRKSLKEITLGTQSFLMAPSWGIFAQTQLSAPFASPNSYRRSFTLFKERFNSLTKNLFCIVRPCK